MLCCCLADDATPIAAYVEAAVQACDAETGKQGQAYYAGMAPSPAAAKGPARTSARPASAKKPAATASAQTAATAQVWSQYDWSLLHDMRHAVPLKCPCMADNSSYCRESDQSSRRVGAFHVLSPLHAAKEYTLSCPLALDADWHAAFETSGAGDQHKTRADSCHAGRLAGVERQDPAGPAAAVADSPHWRPQGAACSGMSPLLGAIAKVETRLFCQYRQFCTLPAPSSAASRALLKQHMSMSCTEADIHDWGFLCCSCSPSCTMPVPLQPSFIRTANGRARSTKKAVLQQRTRGASSGLGGRFCWSKQRFSKELEGLQAA